MNNNDAFTPLADEKIIQLYFARNENAIIETEKKYGKYLISIAFNILKNSEDSEECVNDTYLKTWLTVPPTNPSSLKAYLSRLTRNRAINRYDELNSQKRIPIEVCEPFEELQNVISLDDRNDSGEIAKLIGSIVSEYLDGMNDRDLYIFVARYFYARDIAGIAERLGVSRSTVNKELAKMRAELRKRLLEGGITV